MNQNFSIKPFIRTFSYREPVTSFSLALLLLALFRLTDYYREVDWDERVIKWSLFLIILPVNHIIYKAEHHRSNNFIGRNLHDYIFIIIFVLLQSILNYVVYDRFFNIEDNLVFLLAVIVLLAVIILCFELVIALLKRTLSFFKWQIV